MGQTSNPDDPGWADQTKNFRFHFGFRLVRVGVWGLRFEMRSQTNSSE
jgi:hypothetical protein